MTTDNPYQSPAPHDSNSAPPASQARALGFRHFWANMVLFAVYLVGGMLLTYIHVRINNQSPDFPLDTLGAIFFWSAIPAALYVNWRITAASDPSRRLALAAIVCLLALAIAFIPFFLLLLQFHMAIGGSL